MDWDAISAVGEIIGAMAVVASLVYLGAQIRISNRVARQTAEQHLIDNMNSWYGKISQVDLLADIWLRGARNDDSLTEAEWVRFGGLCNELTWNCERSYILAREGDISEAVSSRDLRLLGLIAGAPGYQKWFAARRTSLTEEFAEYVESLFAKSESYSVPYSEKRSNGT